MLKCKKCKLNKYRKYVLKCLACEQEVEKEYKIVKPEIITPLKTIPLEKLTDREKIYLLANIVGEVSARRIAHLFGVSHHSVTSIVKRSLDKLKGLKIV